jgi:hypothetical protein
VSQGLSRVLQSVPSFSAGDADGTQQTDCLDSAGHRLV